jgi:hypothetical protein
MGGTNESENGPYRFALPNTPSASKFNITDDKEKIQVLESGLYLIYSQVLYVTYGNEAGRNGFMVKTNSSSLPIERGQVFIACILGTGSSTGQSSDEVYKPCYTAGTLYLEAGDVLWLYDPYNLRAIVLRPHLTFFGLVRLSSG